MAFAAAAYAFSATMLGTTLPTPLYPLYQRRFGFSELVVTVVFATYAVGVIVALLLLGDLSDQIGRRPVLGLGILMSALSAGAFLLAGGLVVLLAGRFLSGLSAGIFTGTATATLVDLLGHERAGRATLVAAMANMGGLGCGPLLAGVLAQTVAVPLRIPFWVDLGLLVPGALAVILIPETVGATDRVRLRLRALAVPPEIRGQFIQAALAGFAGFAVLGLCTAVAPAFLGKVIGVQSAAVIGLVVFAAFAGSTAGQMLLERIGEHRAMFVGCAGLIVGMGLFALALATASLAMLVIALVLAGTGQGLSFRAALAGLNSRAPKQQRAAVASSFFIVAYVAISIPVIGEGVLADLAGLRSAGLAFAAVVAAIAAVALAMLARGLPQRDTNA